jgi:integrase
MASIRKRGTKWQAQIRREGFPQLTKTFQFREDALRWGREQERLIDCGHWPHAGKSVDRQSLADVLGRYQREVTSRKRSATSEGFHLRIILRHEIANLPLRKLTPAALCQFRDDRLKQVSASTVRKELNIIQHALKVAEREWGLVIQQEAIKGVTKPAPNGARERRLSQEELDALLGALDQCRNKLVKPVFLFALATGMRRSEVLSLTWSNIDVKSRTAFLPMTKNGSCRTIPLSAAALALLEAQTLQRDLSQDQCFPLSANALRLAWERVKRRANIKDLRFHDLRHEAISRFFEMGLSVPEVSLISGHKDARMLFRYTHLKAERVAQKLQSLDAGFDAHLPTDTAP